MKAENQTNDFQLLFLFLIYITYDESTILRIFSTNYRIHLVICAIELLLDNTSSKIYILLMLEKLGDSFYNLNFLNH